MLYSATPRGGGAEGGRSGLGSRRHKCWDSHGLCLLSSLPRWHPGPSGRQRGVCRRGDLRDLGLKEPERKLFMVHYQPSAQVPARRGGRTAGTTPAAGASSSAGRARARGRPTAFVGPPPRRAALAPVAAARGEPFSPPCLWTSRGGRGRGGLTAAGRRRPAALPPHPPGPVPLPGKLPVPEHGSRAPASGDRGCSGYITGECCEAQSGGDECW